MEVDAIRTRYPKRNRRVVNYEIDPNIDSDPGPGEGNTSEILGGDETSFTSSELSTTPTTTQHIDSVAPVGGDSEDEDATYGSRRTKKQRRVAKFAPKLPAKTKRHPRFKPFRLMDLPPELRMKVYEEALVDPHGVNIRTFADRYESVAVHVSLDNSGGRYPSWDRTRRCYIRGEWRSVHLGALPTKKYQLSPNLLATCKSIHEEAASIYWTQPFIFSDTYGLHAFLLLLRPETISRMRDITILKNGWINGRNLQAFVLLRSASNLQNLRFDGGIRIENTRYGRASEVTVGQRLAERLYKDCYPFLKAIVSHRGAAAILEVLKFDKTEFEQKYYNHVTQNYVEDRWTQERQDATLKAMAAHLQNIMKRKIAPKFPRSRF